MKTSSVLRSYSLLLSLLALIGLGSCDKKPKETPAPAEPATTVALNGLVLDEAQQPVGGAQVQVGALTVTTTAAGTFTVAEAPVSNGRCVVRVRKAGYFEAVHGLRPQAAGARPQLMLTSLGTPQAFTAGAATSLALPGGMRVELPAGALTRNGTAYTGPAQAYVRYLSPQDPQLPRLMPGGDLAALDAAGNAQMLISYGAVRVELEAGGQPLQLAAGRPAELRFPAHGATQPSIPLWHFDTEAGLWKEEGRALRTGNEYVGSVSHFSSWNLDANAGLGGVRGRLLDCAGGPLAGVQLRVGQVEVGTDEAGYFLAPVPAGTASSVQTTWPGSAGAGLQVAVPAVAAGVVHELGTLTACLATVRGRLVDASGAPLAGIVRLSSGAGTAFVMAGADGRFAVVGPAGSSAQLEATTFNGSSARRTATLPATGAAPADLGDICLCTGNQPGGTLIMRFTLDGDGRTNETIELRDAAHYYDRPKAFRDGPLTKLMMGRSTQANYSSAFFTFSGTGVGTYQTTPGTLGCSLHMGINGPAPAIYYETNTGAELTLVVTQYDAVGGRIKGTFSGTMRKRVGTGPLSATTVTVRDGTFDFLRTADQ